MTRPALPKTDSIEALARFRDERDLTDFTASLEEAPAGTFDKGTELHLSLSREELSAIRSEARQRGLSDVELIRRWILERLDTV